MSTEEQRRDQHRRRVQSELTPDVGPVDDEDETCSNCPEDAVYRVPWPYFGGDTAYCAYHLARYRALRLDIWRQLRDTGVPDPEDFATREERFVEFDDLPPKILGGEFRRIALDITGQGLYEQTQPDEDDHVAYVRVDRTLSEGDRIRVHRSGTGQFLGWFRETIGWHAVDDDVRWALQGGDCR
ncbi:hypothetical protein [Halostella sp. PRR32]|uniref:hypothetical protein n=1 Tax=Halostella sp. PRR32 TaxID=3098147 RepID=UPI002B1D26A9|nr:hypothetical protein [Halostella sp. PRR32]